MNLAEAFLSKNLIQFDDHRVTQLLAIHFDCSEQHNMKQFSLTRLQNCTQSPIEIEYTRTLLLFLLELQRKEIKTFAVLQHFKRIE